MLLDDLDLPIDGDPRAFAAAFVSVTRDRQGRTVKHSTRRPVVTDEIGFPADDHPVDFARAFFAVR